MINKNSLKKLSSHRTVLSCGEDFAYVLPNESLSNLISNFTITFPSKKMISDAYTIMPHGSVTLVFFHNANGLHSLLFGPTTQPQKVGAIANTYDIIFIIEFQPAGFFPFTKINQKTLTDKTIPFSSIDDTLDQSLRHLLITSSSAEGLLNAVEKKLLSHIQLLYPNELALALISIIQTQGMITSSEISNCVFYSSRHLNRLFNIYLGMSMKAFSRLVRINKAIDLLNQTSYSLAFVCEKLQYYDVSHFVKDFKIVCGITPQEYREHMSDFYNEIAKY
ncbi:helix-turn-helix domain-containing protein [Beduini massiliensis]|uniref:helix-turn-helix domain-containing protein n=1 Tax=Beduini massiliensis TaxID=1585974 RepID=UPI00059AA651|nr:helix-turn-helix domain-containing protein [Beduini massiliensis]